MSFPAHSRKVSVKTQQPTTKQEPTQKVAFATEPSSQLLGRSEMFLIFASEEWAVHSGKF